MNMQDILNIVWTAVGTVLTALLTWGTTALINWIKTKISNEKAVKWLADITEIVMNAVKTIMQTYVDGLKKEGAFTKEAQEEALRRCLSIVMSQLTPELTEYIQTNFGDITEYLKTLIEASIYSLKK